MQPEVEVLHGKVKIPVILMFICLLLGCSIRDSKESALIDIHSAYDQVVSSTQSADDFLADSVEIPNIEKSCFSFLPVAVNDGKLFGIMMKDDSYVDSEFAYVDIQSGEYHTIRKAKGDKEFATFSYLAASDERVLFWENNQTENEGGLDLYLDEVFLNNNTTMMFKCC